MSRRSDLKVGDDELVAATRDGDAAAYAELWRRHAGAAATAARHFTSVAEADDLVAESYTRILDAIRHGAGPTGAFRPYLYSTLRNLARAWSHHEDPVQVEDFDAFVDPKGSEDPGEKAMDRTITVAAFRSLPERWQTALWYSEVEQLDPHEIAPLLGTNANGAAALAYRAREGLRRAWLQAHINDRNTPPECRWTVQRLGRYARGGLSEQESSRLEEHLLGCTRCTVIAAEVQDVASRLAIVVAPLFLGGIGATALLASLRAGGSAAATAAGATVAGANTAGASTTGGAGGGGAAAAGAATTTAWVVGGSIAAGIAAAAVTVTLVVGAASPAAQPKAAPPAAAAATASPPPDSEATPLPVPTASPAPVVDPVAPSPTPSPRRPAAPAPVAAAPDPTPTPSVPSPPADTVALPPVVSTVIDPTAPVRPGLTGTAEPNATVTVADEDGTLATVVADGAGAWTTPPLSGLTPTATSLSVLQRDPAGNVSSPTLLGPFAFAPRFTAPSSPADCVSGATLSFSVQGWAGETVIIDGVGGGPMTIANPSGSASFDAQCLLPGNYTLSVRYQDGTASTTISGTVRPF